MSNTSPAKLPSGPKREVIAIDDPSVNRELAALDLTKEIIANIADAVASAKADTMAVEPLNAAGINAYNKGVASIRINMLTRKGWRMCHKGGVEATVNDELAIQLIYQSVDMACTERDPQAISGKGSGARQLVYEGQQQEMFERVEGQRKQIHGVAPRVWLICVSTSGKKLRAEVSCPDLFEGNQYDGFSKRIFVVDQDYEPSPGTLIKPDEDSGAADYEVKIVKK